jgi:hypothetical protein
MAMDDDPEQALEQLGDELDERVHKLEDSIDKAKEAATAEELVGDWDQTDDQAGGEDPVGAHEERDEASEDKRPENE